MRIEIKEKGTPEFYKEVVDVSAQYLRLMKKPESRLKDTFKMLKGYIALCVVFLALVLIMGFAWGLDALTLVVTVVMLAALAVSILQLRRMNKMVQSLIDDPRTSVFTLDEDGVELDKEQAELIRVSWSNVAFVRIFSESICFFAKGGRGLVLAVNKGRAQEILGYIRDHQVDVRII